MKQRFYYLDNICAILIFYIIYIYHISFLFGCYKYFVFKYVGITLSFFMSWFFFKGGMMHKKSSFKEVINKSTKRLLVPYFIFLLIGLLIDCLGKFTGNGSLTILVFLKEEFETVTNTSILWPTGASWFLLSLFVVRFSFNYLFTKVHPIIISIFFAFAAYGISIIHSRGWSFNLFGCTPDMHLYIPFYIGNMCHGLSLYSLGYFIKEKQFHKYILFFALFLFVLKFFFPAGIDFRANNSYGSNFLLAILYGMAGCIVVNNVFRRYLNYSVPLVTYIGSNSMLYYLIHYPIISLSLFLFGNIIEEYNIWVRFFVISIIVTFSLLIAELIFRNKSIRFVIGG